VGTRSRGLESVDRKGFLPAMVTGVGGIVGRWDSRGTAVVAHFVLELGMSTAWDGRRERIASKISQLGRPSVKKEITAQNKELSTASTKKIRTLETSRWRNTRESVRGEMSPTTPATIYSRAPEKSLLNPELEPTPETR